jgi:hypothetical protein
MVSWFWIKSNDFKKLLLNKVHCSKQHDLHKQVGVLEAALLYFKLFFPKTGNKITHQSFSSDAVMNGK